MLRIVALACVLAMGLTACNSPAPVPKAAPPVVTTTAPVVEPPAALPSVPSDIVRAAKPRKARAKPQPDATGAAEANTGRDSDRAYAGGDQREDEAPLGPEDEYAEAQPADDAQPRPRESAGNDAAHWDGVGDVTFGANADDVLDAWAGDLDGEVTEDCSYLSESLQRPAAAPALMFEDSRFVRYEVDTPHVQAPGGGRVDMDADEIEDLYGDAIERTPHKYTDGEYLRIESPDGDSALLFETDERGVVTEWRIGQVPQVDYVEGCS